MIEFYQIFLILKIIYVLESTLDDDDQSMINEFFQESSLLEPVVNNNECIEVNQTSIRTNDEKSQCYGSASKKMKTYTVDPLLQKNIDVATNNINHLPRVFISPPTTLEYDNDQGMYVNI